MVTVYLHGELGVAMGRKIWHFDIRSPSEAIRAIEANTGKMYSFLREREDLSYRIIADRSEPNVPQELAMPRRNMKKLHFVPVIQGAGNEGVWLLVAGIVLLSVATFGFGAFGAVGAGGLSAFGVAAPVAGSFGAAALGALTTIGLALTVAGIGQLIIGPQSKTDFGGNPERKPSFLWGGAVNSVTQGNPVPFAAGMHRIGSQIVSAGITTADLLPVVTALP